MMRRTPAVAAAAVLIVTSLALAGCSTWLEGTAKPANDAIATANAHLKKATETGASVTDAVSSLDAVPYTKEGATRALELTVQIKSDMKTQKAELALAKAAMDSIAQLEVDPELKAYAALESTAIATRMRVVDLGTKLYTEMEKLYSALSKGQDGAPDNQKILINVENIRRDITAVSELAAQQAKTATDYFAAKNLGG